MFSKLYVVLILLSVIVGSIVFSLIETNDNTSVGDLKYIKYTEYSLYASATILGVYMLFYSVMKALLPRSATHRMYAQTIGGFILLSLNIWMMVNSIIVFTSYTDSVHIDLARNIGVVMTATLCMLTGIIFTIGLGISVLTELNYSTASK